MFYAIRHFTRYRYTRPVWQSMLEVGCIRAARTTSAAYVPLVEIPPGEDLLFTDYLGNQVHHFDLPSPHREITIIADSLVNIIRRRRSRRAAADSWSDLRRMIDEDDHWQMLMPSYYARAVPADDLAREPGPRPGCTRSADPRPAHQRRHPRRLHRAQEHRVNSPIAVSLLASGVCQTSRIS
jgi:transglutaminase-like putative cysteine protease